MPKANQTQSRTRFPGRKQMLLKPGNRNQEQLC